MNFFRLPLLSRAGGLRHVFVGRWHEPRPDPAELLTELDPPGPPPALARLRQVHSGRCLVVDRAPAPADGVVGEADALATSAPGVAVAIATADCLPLVAFDPGSRALAVVHAGWRGTLAGVLPAALETMRLKLGAAPDTILIGAGPAVGVCCYRVGAEVAERFAARWPDHIKRITRSPAPAVTHLDLLEANRLQAIDAGVHPERIAAIDLCTVCHPRQTHSYRRDGERAGRMWTLAMLAP